MKKNNINLIIIVLGIFLLISYISVMNTFINTMNYSLLWFSFSFIIAFYCLYSAKIFFSKSKKIEAKYFLFKGFLSIYIFDEVFLVPGPMYLTLLEIILIGFLGIYLTKFNNKQNFLFLIVYSLFVVVMNLFEFIPRADIFSREFLYYYQPFITLFDISLFFGLIIFEEKRTMQSKIMTSFIYFAVIPQTLITFFFNYKNNDISILQDYTFYGSLFLILLIIRFSQLVAEFLVKPINSLAENMSVVSNGDFRIFKIDNMGYETYILYDRFRQMTEKLASAFAALNNEVNERKISEHKLKITMDKLFQSDRKYRAVSQSSRDMIFSLNNEFKFVYVSPNMPEILGYSDWDILKYNFSVIFNIDKNSDIKKMIKEIREKNGDRESSNKVENYNFKIELLNGKNKKLWINLVFSTVYDEIGRFVEMICMARDISEVVKYEKELENVNDIIKDYNIELKKLEDLKIGIISNLTHELRSPLVTIKGYSQFLSKKEDIPQKYIDKLNIIDRNSDRLTRMIDRLVFFSKLYSENYTFSNETIVISDFCTKIVSEYKNNQKNIVFSCDIKDCIISFDRESLYFTLCSLLDNAFKFSNSEIETRVELKIFKNHNFIVFNVTDNGIGIEKERLDIMKEEFSDMDLSQKAEHDGTGTGLILVKKVLDMYKSKLIIKSEKNIGSEFSFSILENL